MGRASEQADIGVELAALVVATSSLDELLVGMAGLTARAVPAAVSASVALTAPAWSGHAIAVDERAARLEARQRHDGANAVLATDEDSHASGGSVYSRRGRSGDAPMERTG